MLSRLLPLLALDCRHIRYLSYKSFKDFIGRIVARAIICDHTLFIFLRPFSFPSIDYDPAIVMWQTFTSKYHVFCQANCIFWYISLDLFRPAAAHRCPTVDIAISMST